MEPALSENSNRTVTRLDESSGGAYQVACGNGTGVLRKYVKRVSEIAHAASATRRCS